MKKKEKNILPKKFYYNWDILIIFFFSDPAFFLQSISLVPFAAGKRDTIGNILSSSRDPGSDPGLVFSMLTLDSRVLCMCQVICFSYTKNPEITI